MMTPLNNVAAVAAPAAPAPPAKPPEPAASQASAELKPDTVSISPAAQKISQASGDQDHDGDSH